MFYCFIFLSRVSICPAGIHVKKRGAISQCLFPAKMESCPLSSLTIGRVKHQRGGGVESQSPLARKTDRWSSLRFVLVSVPGSRELTTGTSRRKYVNSNFSRNLTFKHEAGLLLSGTLLPKYTIHENSLEFLTTLRQWCNELPCSILFLFFCIGKDCTHYNA